ncbi:TAXI family TRAP transporter solute-binding subunit [Candidatus Parabeggiatoa sp. HSG14]|uniref:TAXI family TRAP transporter solute-binding subunit n=1 Tax=Candidatus Parabeggiatoa sp. HSG14 TaxID=3055593 RepID=UPI0025A7CDE1|nr:TAXI family TRAP transporter solute-binding subunit [Thiotrichales bacterium HSG14]
MKKWLVAGLVFVFSTNVFATDFFTIGTGGITGLYFPMGVVICRWVNTQTPETNLHCTVEATDGSVANINQIKEGTIAFGLAQSDVIYQLYRGINRFKGKAYKNLRSVMAIYPEVLTLVVNKNAGISVLQDIKGKRINVGNPGSGTEVITTATFNEAGFSKQDLALAAAFSLTECPTALQKGQIDGYFFMVGHPTANIRIANSLTAIDIIPLENKVISQMVKKFPYLIKGTIPWGLYEGIDEKVVQSIGVKATLVTSVDTSDELVRLVVKTILDNFEYLKYVNPLLRQEAVTKKGLTEGRFSAPLHPAAKKYYQEMGLLEE